MVRVPEVAAGDEAGGAVGTGGLLARDEEADSGFAVGGPLAGGDGGEFVVVDHVVAVEVLGAGAGADGEDDGVV